MSESLDERLRELGNGMPFPVDWVAYEGALMRRLNQAEVRRRRVWWALLAGAAAGAAVVAILFRPSPTPAEGEGVAGMAVPPALKSQAREPDSPGGVSKPMAAYVRTIRNRDGSLGVIRIVSSSRENSNRRLLIGSSGT